MLTRLLLANVRTPASYWSDKCVWALNIAGYKRWGNGKIVLAPPTLPTRNPQRFYAHWRANPMEWIQPGPGDFPVEMRKSTQNLSIILRPMALVLPFSMLQFSLMVSTRGTQPLRDLARPDGWGIDKKATRGWVEEGTWTENSMEIGMWTKYYKRGVRPTQPDRRLKQRRLVLSHEKQQQRIPGAFKMKLFSVSFLCATLTAALQISVESSGGNSSIFQYGLMLEVRFQSNWIASEKSCWHELRILIMAEKVACTPSLFKIELSRAAVSTQGRWLRGPLSMVLCSLSRIWASLFHQPSRRQWVWPPALEME